MGGHVWGGICCRILMPFLVWDSEMLNDSQLVLTSLNRTNSVVLKGHCTMNQWKKEERTSSQSGARGGADRPSSWKAGYVLLCTFVYHSTNVYTVWIFQLVIGLHVQCVRMHSGMDRILPLSNTYCTIWCSIIMWGGQAVMVNNQGHRSTCVPLIRSGWGP